MLKFQIHMDLKGEIIADLITKHSLNKLSKLSNFGYYVVYRNLGVLCWYFLRRGGRTCIMIFFLVKKRTRNYLHTLFYNNYFYKIAKFSNNYMVSDVIFLLKKQEDVCLLWTIDPFVGCFIMKSKRQKQVWQMSVFWQVIFLFSFK